MKTAPLEALLTAEVANARIRVAFLESISFLKLKKRSF
jgi:hypothetical protein